MAGVRVVVKGLFFSLFEVDTIALQGCPPLVGNDQHLAGNEWESHWLRPEVFAAVDQHKRPNKVKEYLTLWCMNYINHKEKK